ncbi:response regulator [bacterium]|nr:response regulator [bacterium]
MENTILLVDDEPNILKSISRILQGNIYKILTAGNGIQALDILGKNSVDLIITDYKMPEMNGIDLLNEVRILDPDVVRIMMSAYSDRDLMANAINRGEVFRFIFKPWEDEFLLDVLKQGLEWRKEIISKRINLQRQLNNVNLETVMALAEAIELKDIYTKGHCNRVQDYSIIMAKECGMSNDVILPLVFGSLLHDCGKIGISESILLFQGTLDLKQRKAIERHSVLGFEITSRIKMLQTASLFIRQHHERWDGKGYPDGLMGEKIHVCSRIIAIADTFDAMTSDRPYRKGMPKEKAMVVLNENSGTQFDPSLVKLFTRLMKDMEPGEVSLYEVDSSKKPIQILLVDDEKHVISAITRSLFDEDYEIHAATDGKKGLEILDNQKIDVIISDQRMPGMTGVEFLKRAREKHPTAVRIMLSGYADINAALDAINEAGIYKFLVKPWDETELKQTIKKALEWQHMYFSSYNF